MPAEKSLAAYSSICLPAQTPSIEANCHRNPKWKKSSFFHPLWMSGSCIHLIHLKAKLMRSNESQADDLSLRSPKSYSPYLVLLPSTDGNCMNVSSNRLCCKRSYLRSTAYLLVAHKIEPQFTRLHVKGFILECDMWYIHLEEKVLDIFFLLTHMIASAKNIITLQVKVKGWLMT